MFTYIPDHLKTQYMCNDAVERDVWMFKYVPDRLKTQEMCVDVDHLKTQYMCNMQ